MHQTHGDFSNPKHQCNRLIFAFARHAAWETQASTVRQKQKRPRSGRL